jgi:ankyrin repeat protein
MDSFKYDPIDLDGRSFRLLQICYGSDGPIECHLFDACLDYTIEYEALSYTWGDLDQPYNISLNDSPMSVTVNLFQALWALRYPDRDRTVWVDAICINQEDVKERGHQVAQMTSIYKNAEKVVVWLGRSDLDTGSVFRHMRQLEKVATEHAYHDWEVSDRRWQDLWSTAKPMLDEESTNWLHQQRRGLESIFRQPWFTRVWIIQEIANARSATIMCGTAVVSSRVFAAMPSLVGLVLDPHCQAILDIMPGPLRKHSWWAQNRDLHTLLLKFRWSKASDPRDAIYALVGISSDACNSKCLVPDYELSEDDVVRNTMAFILRFRDPEIAPPPLPNWSLPEFMENLEFLVSTVISWAVGTGNMVLASQLLGWHESSSEKHELDGEKLLLSAVKNRHTAMAKFLHDMGKCNINGIDGDQRTPMIRAAVDADAASLKVLLDTDRAVLDTEDKDGQTAFTVALENRDWAILELLLKHLATGDLNGISTSRLQEIFTQSDQFAIINLSLKLPGVAGLKKRHIQKQLFRAAKEGTEYEMELLLDMEEADINSKEEGETLLSLAARKGHDKVVKLLLEYGTDIDPMDENRATPLLLATHNGHERVVKLLLNTGKANLCACDTRGRTPFISAVRKGNKSIVKLLTEVYNPIMEAHNLCAGQTPLRFAISHGNSMIFEVLLRSGKFSPNEKDCWGNTLLLWAVHEKRTEIIETLLSVADIDVDSEDECGRTPLFLAVEYANKAAVHQLLQRSKANVNHQNLFGSTPLSWAKHEQAKHEQANIGDRADILEMLLDRDKAAANVTTDDFRKDTFLGA